MTAIIWFLRKFQDGEFCTLLHVIELMQTKYDSLFTILKAEKEIEVLINPFVTAYLNGAIQQLEGQIGSIGCFESHNIPSLECIGRSIPLSFGLRVFLIL